MKESSGFARRPCNPSLLPGDPSGIKFGMTDSPKRPAPILAAGGIVLRGNSRPRIAVVRMRREKAWVLPKGKLLPREHPRDAAKREVLEETGHEVSVHEFLGSMSYAVEGKIKIVQFWLMRATGPTTTGRAGMPCSRASFSSESTLAGFSENVVAGSISGTM